MSKAKIFTDRNLKIGNVEAALFSSFIEHLGRAVYTGIYEPGHPEADEDGFRKDVLELVKGLNVPMVRYPGGNFVSGYDWKDGIGKKSQRPTRLDLAWATTESNRFGTDEFMNWCKKAGTEPMMAVNLGTGTPLDAAQLVEYCNHPGGSYFSDLRGQNGYPDPYKVKTWCLGNEMDGPWQVCHMSAEDYSKKALAAGKMMKLVDPGIKLVACGSSSAEMPTYPEWDRVVLENLYDHVDYISMHQYYWMRENEADFFASYHDMNEFIKAIKATADYVKVKLRSSKTIGISFDEWNVWYQNAQGAAEWKHAPHILEDIYNLRDALVFGGLINTLLNNCDRVKIACLAQLVNVIAPIFTQEGGMAVKQAIYYPLEMVSCYGRGTALNCIVECEKFESKKWKSVDSISSSIIHNEDERSINAFFVNYGMAETELELELRGFDKLAAKSCSVINGTDLEAKNTFDKPDAVTPKNGELPVVKNETVFAKLPPLSYTMLQFRYE